MTGRHRREPGGDVRTSVPSATDGTEAATAVDGGRVQAARGAAWLGLVTVLTKGSQVAVTLALAAFLDSAELGRVAVVFALLNLGQVLQMMGVYDVVARTTRPPRRFAGTVATLCVALGLVMAVLMAVGRHRAAELVGAPGAADLIGWAGLGLPFVAYGGVQMALMHRDLDFKARLVPDAASALLGAVLIVVLAASGAGAASAVVGVVTTMVTLPFFCLLVGVRIPFHLDRHDAREALRWAGVVGPGAVVALVLLNVDYVVVTRLLGEAQTGLYSLAFRIASVPYFAITYVLGAVAFPLVTRHLRAGEPDGARRAMAEFLFATAVFVGGIFTLIGLLADRVVLLSPRWQDSGPVLVVLCVFGVGLSVQYMSHEFLRASGGSRWYLASQVLHLGIVLPLLLVLTARDGIVGTARAQLVAVAVSLAITVGMLSWSGTLRARDWLRAFGRVPLAWAVVVAGGLLLRRVPGLDDPSSWAGSTVLGLLLVALLGLVYTLLEHRRMPRMIALVLRRGGSSDD